MTRESQKFVSTLLLHEAKNEPVCRDIISTAAEPLTANNFNAQIHAQLEETYLDQNKLLCSTLDLLTSILENTLFVNMDYSILDLMDKIIGLKMRVKALFEACISTRFLQHVHKLYVLLIFADLKRGIKGHGELVDITIWNQFRSDECYIFMMLLSKKYIMEFVKSCKFSLVYWKKLTTLREFTLPDDHKFEHQMIALMVVHITLSHCSL